MNSRIIKIAVTGAAGSGKTDFCKSLCDPDFRQAENTLDISALIDNDVIVDFFSYKDPTSELEINFHKCSSNPLLQDFTKKYLDAAELIALTINPASPDYETHKAYALDVIQNSTMPKFGYLILLTGSDVWLNQENIEERVKNLEEELSAYEVMFLPVSAKNPLPVVFCDEIKQLVPNVSQYKKTVRQQKKMIEQHLQAYEEKLMRRTLNPDYSRAKIIAHLRVTLASCAGMESVKDAVLFAIRDLRTDKFNGKKKYGFKLFKLQFGSYKKSALYQELESILKQIAPTINVEYETRPVKPFIAKGYQAFN